MYNTHLLLYYYAIYITGYFPLLNGSLSIHTNKTFYFVTPICSNDYILMVYRLLMGFIIKTR